MRNDTLREKASIALKAHTASFVSREEFLTRAEKQFSQAKLQALSRAESERFQAVDKKLSIMNIDPKLAQNTYDAEVKRIDQAFKQEIKSLESSYSAQREQAKKLHTL